MSTAAWADVGARREFLQPGCDSRRGDRRGNHLLAVGEPRVTNRQHRWRDDVEAFEIDGLDEAAVVAERFQSPLAHLRGEVGGGNPLVARAAAAAVDRVAGEELHVASHRRFVDRRACRGGPARANTAGAGG